MGKLQQLLRDLRKVLSLGEFGSRKARHPSQDLCYLALRCLASKQCLCALYIHDNMCSRKYCLIRSGQSQRSILSCTLNFAFIQSHINTQSRVIIHNFIVILSSLNFSFYFIRKPSNNSSVYVHLFKHHKTLYFIESNTFNAIESCFPLIKKLFNIMETRFNFFFLLWCRSSCSYCKMMFTGINKQPARNTKVFKFMFSLSIYLWLNITTL